MSALRYIALCALVPIVLVPAERFTAVAVNSGNPGPAWTSPVDIVVTHWSSEADQSELTGVLLARGEAALLEALRDRPSVGYIRTPNSLSYDLRFAREFPGDDGGRRIVLGTDWPIMFWEAWHRPRSIDYPFTIVELRLNREGQGEGKMSSAARITVDRAHNAIVLENYGLAPVQLMNVRTVAPTT